MPADVRTWPPLLAGPIVRRVVTEGADSPAAAKTSVSVWVATRQAGPVSLIVRAGTDTGSPQVSTGTTSTKRLGENLHVAVVTATTTAGSPLSSGTVYGYDVEIPNGNASSDLASLKLLG